LRKYLTIHLDEGGSKSCAHAAGSSSGLSLPLFLRSAFHHMIGKHRLELGSSISSNICNMGNTSLICIRYANFQQKGGTCHGTEHPFPPCFLKTCEKVYDSSIIIASFLFCSSAPCCVVCLLLSCSFFQYIYSRWYIGEVHFTRGIAHPETKNEEGKISTTMMYGHNVKTRSEKRYRVLIMMLCSGSDGSQSHY
jgi:hypothetical protein